MSTQPDVRPNAALANLRDVASASENLVHGMLLRSDALLRDDDHSGYPVSWPPRTVIDLRDRGEQLDSAHPLEDVTTIVRLPLLGGRAYDLDNLPASLDELYLDMLHSAPQLFVELVDKVASASAPVLVHCAAGKDRTGVSVALVLALLGIEEDAIVADYLLTADFMPGVLARMSVGHRIGAADDVTGLDELGPMHTASEEAIRSVLAAWNDEGGAESWYLANGGNEMILVRLRERLLVAEELQ